MYLCTKWSPYKPMFEKASISKNLKMMVRTAAIGPQIFRPIRLVISIDPSIGPDAGVVKLLNHRPCKYGCKG